MPKFVATHSFGSGLREMLAEQGPDIIAALKQAYPPFVWNGMYADWETGKAVCLWEAPNAQTIIDQFQRMGIPYEHVFPVEWVTPHDLATGT
jgi:hypothetical protein